MKFLKISLTICFLLFLSIQSNAKSSLKKMNILLKSEINTPLPKKNKFLTAEPSFLLMNDGCYHLVQMNPPGYISAQGVYYTTWSMTFIGSLDCNCTTTYCMEPEVWATFC